jgi:hypothetical protein
MIDQHDQDTAEKSMLGGLGTAFADVRLDRGAGEVMARGRALRRRRKAVPALAAVGILAAALSLAAVTRSAPSAAGPHTLGYHGAVVNVDEAGFSIHTDPRTGAVTVTTFQLFDGAEMKALLAKAGVPAAFHNITYPAGTSVWWNEGGLPDTGLPKGAIVEPEMLCKWTGVSTLDSGNIISQPTQDGAVVVTTIYPSRMPAGSVLGIRYVTVGTAESNLISTTLLSGQPTGCVAPN